MAERCGLPLLRICLCQPSPPPASLSPSVAGIAARTFRSRPGTVLHSSNIPLSKWAIAFYLFMTNLKGVSSMKLHRDLGISQKSAWHMAHRIREALDTAGGKFVGPVEADETYIGGSEKNKHADKKLRAGRGTVGKTPVVGVKDRTTNQVHTEVVESTNKATLQGFVTKHTTEDAVVYTDEASAYKGLPRYHEAVAHGTGEYVRGMAHTNGLESHWALFKRGIDGVYHHISGQAPAPLQQRIRGAPQPAATGHCRTDGVAGPVRRWEAAQVRRSDGVAVSGSVIIDRQKGTRYRVRRPNR